MSLQLESVETEFHVHGDDRNDRRVTATFRGSAHGPRYRADAELLSVVQDPTSNDVTMTVRINMATAERMGYMHRG